MRYLRSIESFKKLKYEERILTTELRPIREQFENDVTWGGSLIGRLINSTVRVLGVRYNATKIDSLVDELKKCLEILLVEESSFSERNKFRELRKNALLTELYKVVNESNLNQEEKLRIILSVSDYEQRMNRQSGVGTPQNASFKFNQKVDKIFEYAEEKKEEEGEKEDKDTSGDGLLDITIRDIKSCEFDKKEELLEKLDKFKKLLMEIEYKKDEEKKEPSKETKKKFKLYSETRKFLEGYLDVIRQIEANAVKQKSPFKKGDIVMWKRTTGASKGALAFGEVLQDIQENDDDIQVKGLDKGNKFSLPIKLALALTFFDEEYYKKMRETNPKEISLKLIKAKIGYYTFMNKKDRAKMSFYEGEMDRLEKKLPKDRESEFSDLESQDKPQGSSKPTVSSAGNTNKGALPQQKKDTTQGGLVKASFEYYLDDEHLILEEADVRISTKEQIGAWGYIVDVYSEMKKKTDMKKHMQKISDLLEGKPSGNEARKTITSLGKKIHELLTSKYKPVPINDLKNFTKETPTTVVKTESLNFIFEADEAKESSETAENVADAETICQLARVILSLEQDMTLAKSFVDRKGEGVSKSILKMISSFDGIKDAVNEEKKNENNGLLKKYSDFKLILEADDGPEEGEFGDVSDDEGDDDNDDDSEQSSSGGQQESESEVGELDNVQIAWFDTQSGGRGPFRRGEEKEWVINVEEIKKPIGPEKRKISIEVPDGGLDDPKLDPIIRIMNIFGKAYSLYATDYIPSGRPEGRVSQRTLREYEFIGKGSEGEARGERGKDYFTPGYGPWAAKRVFEKWENGVNSILEDKWYRKVLANVNYVSQAERETGIEQIEGSSGITLLKFITEMLTLKGTFKENKRTLMLKYFNANMKDDEIDNIKKRDKSPIKNVKGLKTDEPFFSNISQYNIDKGFNEEVLGAGNKIVPGYFYRVKCKVGDDEKIYILWAFYNNGGKILFRAHESEARTPEEAFISSRFGDPSLGYKTTQIIPRSARTQRDKDVFIIGLTYTQVRRFKKAGEIKVMQVKNIDRIDTNDFVEKIWQIGNSDDAIQIMVVPQLISDTQARTKPVVVAWSENFKAIKDHKVETGKIGELKRKMR